ncbi:hypothetical protein [Shinella sp.]|uniref:hypothetical protein n=1 Tax=Shinella sp. TaxID=1870904 RepID=UPI003F70EE56
MKHLLTFEVEREFDGDWDHTPERPPASVLRNNDFRSPVLEVDDQARLSREGHEVGLFHAGELALSFVQQWPAVEEFGVRGRWFRLASSNGNGKRMRTSAQSRALAQEPFEAV